MHFYLEQLAREAFKEFDKDNSGTIDQKVDSCVSSVRGLLLFFPFQELTAVLRCMGQNPTDSEVNDMLNEVDVDGTGLIEFDEFVRFAVRLFCRQGDVDQEVRELFRRCKYDLIIHERFNETELLT